MSAAKPRAANHSVGSYCIWTKTGRKPQYFHPSLDHALAEAQRLAAGNPGKKFIVMQVIEKVVVDPPVEQVPA